jgi:hypothetical protein
MWQPMKEICIEARNVAIANGQWPMKAISHLANLQWLVMVANKQ